MVGFERKKMDCYVYFKTAAFVEFRYKFVYSARLELAMYGHDEPLANVPDPWTNTETTDPWWPTDKKLVWGNFKPVGLPKWDV
ncbi:uncharacterized protein LOC113231366 [Hyposmocoma kahamanoa]|uniref:uncharacterized protein LOC113231366 n=1 Tax=Hyposmocoma kahamanoa TaxID=1477025 RepID=UPI000E6D972A|nr:uncharacterized protein LOC113231366 [Hyposmocoma kahamanoa]